MYESEHRQLLPPSPLRGYGATSRLRASMVQVARVSRVEPEIVLRRLGNLTNQHWHHASLGDEPRARTMQGAEKVATRGIHTPQSSQVDPDHRARCRRDDLLPADQEFADPVAREVAFERQHQLAINPVCRNSEHGKSTCHLL